MASQVTVLLATDEPELLDALGFALNHRGYHVVAAVTGDGALALADLQLPDIAVLDMMLPGPSGFQLATNLKERSDGLIPIVMISDLTAPAHRDYAFAGGLTGSWKVAGPDSPSRDGRGLCPLPVESPRPGSGTLPQPSPTRV